MNLKEELNRLDRESIDNNTKYYDLKNLFEAIILTDEEKKELAKLIKDKEDPEVIYDNLSKKYGHDLSDLEIEEDYVHRTDEHTFNPLATAATLKVGDKVYDSTGEKVLEIVDKQMPNDWSTMLTVKDVATGDTWVQHSGNLALFELVVEGDYAEEVPEDIDIEFHPLDELTGLREALVDEDKWTKEVLDILKTVLDKADDIRYEMKYATRGSRIKVNDINGLVSWLNDFNEDIEKASKELEERNDELTNGPQEENNNENQ